MKYLKKFENINDDDDIEYSIGDIVICVDECSRIDSPKFGEKYEVLDIFDADFHDRKYDSVNATNIRHCYVDVRDIKTLKIKATWFAYRFMLEIKYNANKYNL